MEPGSLIELIDFSSETPPTRLSYAERIAHAGIAISRCKVEPNPGTMLGATQFVVAIHEGDPIEMEWRPAEKEQIERCRIVAGDLHFNPADRHSSCAGRVRRGVSSSGWSDGSSSRS